MNGPYTEADWKLFRRYEKSMLEELTGRINRESMAILEEIGQTEHERFLSLYRHIHGLIGRTAFSLCRGRGVYGQTGVDIV